MKLQKKNLEAEVKVLAADVVKEDLADNAEKAVLAEVNVVKVVSVEVKEEMMDQEVAIVTEVQALVVEEEETVETLDHLVMEDSDLKDQKEALVSVAEATEAKEVEIEVVLENHSVKEKEVVFKI